MPVTLESLSKELLSAAKPGRWRFVSRLVLFLVALVAGIYACFGPPTPVTTAASQVPAAELAEARANAEAASRQWATYTYTRDISIPPQAPDAEAAMEEARRHMSGKETRAAANAFRRATDLFAAALKMAQDVENKRTQAVNARVTLDVAVQPWEIMVHSIHVELPLPVVQAFEARREAEIRFLRKQYEESLAACELSSRMIRSVSPAVLQRLQIAHEAGEARQAAMAAAEGWARLRQATDLPAPAAADQAKQRMAEAQSVYSSGELSRSAPMFAEAHRRYQQAADEIVQAIIVRQQSVDAHEQATQDLRNWRSLAGLLGSADATELQQAQRLFEEGVELSRKGSHEPARAKFQQVAGMAESERRKLQELAKSRANEHETRIQRLLAVLAEQEKELSNRLKAAEERVSALQEKLGGAGQAPSELEVFTQASRERLRLARVARFCAAHVFSGPRQKGAKEALGRAAVMRNQGEAVAAVIVLEAAVGGLNELVRLSSDAEAYYELEDKVVELTQSTNRQLGPAAMALPEVNRLIEEAKINVSKGREAMLNGDAALARRALGDAEEGLRRAPGQACYELLNSAEFADAASRFDAAETAIREVLRIAPDDEKARRQLDQVLAHRGQPRDQIALVEGQLYLMGARVPARPKLKDFTATLGEPRDIKGNVSYVFDDRGIIVVPDAEATAIRSMLVFYAQPTQPHEPKKMFPGVIKIDGYEIGRDDTLEKINEGMRRVRFEPTPRAEHLRRAKFGPYMVRLNYDAQTKRIYTIAIDFQSP